MRLDFYVKQNVSFYNLCLIEKTHVMLQHLRISAAFRDSSVLFHTVDTCM